MIKRTELFQKQIKSPSRIDSSFKLQYSFVTKRKYLNDHC